MEEVIVLNFFYHFVIVLKFVVPASPLGGSYKTINNSTRTHTYIHPDPLISKVY